MSLNCRAYSYIFFEIPSEFTQTEEVCPDALSFFKQWVNVYDLQFHPPPNLKTPNATMLRLAAKSDLSVCIIRFHDLDIVEIGWQKAEPPLELWEKSLDEFQKQIGKTRFFGVKHLLSAPSGTVPQEKLKDKKYSEISGVGSLYRVGKDAYLLLSQGDKTKNFITRDFPLMDSALHKLEFEEGELRKLVNQNRESGSRIRKRMKEGLQAVETHFEDIRQYQTWLRQTLILQTKLRQTLEINIVNLRNIGKTYLSPENDSLFRPRIEHFRRLYRQTGYDLNYARLNAEEMESQIQLLELKISQNRLKIERQFVRWTGLIGIPLGIGGATTSMENWDKRLPLMFGGAILFALCWCLWPKLFEIIKRVERFCKSFYPLSSLNSFIRKNKK